MHDSPLTMQFWKALFFELASFPCVSLLFLHTSHSLIPQEVGLVNLPYMRVIFLFTGKYWNKQRKNGWEWNPAGFREPDVYRAFIWGWINHYCKVNTASDDWLHLRVASATKSSSFIVYVQLKVAVAAHYIIANSAMATVPFWTGVWVWTA